MDKDKFLPYGCQSINEQDVESVCKALTSGWLTTGPKVAEFEQAVSAYSGAAHGVAVNSGTAALHTAMFAFDLKEGDEVIVPPMTFAATANCISYMGAKPVFVDVEPDTLLISPEKVEQAITPATRGIIAVDYAGQPCDYDALRLIADKHDLFLAADACHSIGADLNQKKVGTLADITTYSFHPVKHITTAEGGMSVTDNPFYAERMRSFRNHGINTEASQRDGWYYEMQDLGFNYRISDMQCALGLSQLTRLDEWIGKRRGIAARYNDILRDIEWLAPLAVKPEARHVFHLYVVQINGDNNAGKREKLFNFLRENGIGVQVHYIPVHLHPYYKKKFGTHEGMCPIAEKAYDGIISLPIFPGMDNTDVERVCELLKNSQFAL